MSSTTRSLVSVPAGMQDDPVKRRVFHQLCQSIANEVYVVDGELDMQLLAQSLGAAIAGALKNLPYEAYASFILEVNCLAVTCYARNNSEEEGTEDTPPPPSETPFSIN